MFVEVNGELIYFCSFIFFPLPGGGHDAFKSLIGINKINYSRGWSFFQLGGNTSVLFLFCLLQYNDIKLVSNRGPNFQCWMHMLPEIPLCYLVEFSILSCALRVRQQFVCYLSELHSSINRHKISFYFYFTQQLTTCSCQSDKKSTLLQPQWVSLRGCCTQL